MLDIYHLIGSKEEFFLLLNKKNKLLLKYIVILSVINYNKNK